MKISKKIGNFIINKYGIRPFFMWLYTQKWYSDLILKWLPKIRFSTTYPVPENKDFIHWGALEKRGYKHLKKGDLIFTHDNKKLLTRLIGKATAEEGADFVPSHAALCVDAIIDSEFQIAEMTQHNYTESTWSDLCHESTRVIIARCSDFSEDYINKALVPKCLSFKDRKYDIKMIQGSEELVCSEMVYFSDVSKKMKVKLDPLIGHEPYISPMGLLKGKNIEIIWDSNKERK